MTFMALDKSTDETDHAENCCEAHGCKWGSHDCPVTSHALKQAYPCEECDKLADSLADGGRWW